jgi:limonene-1,2-epoxide hydrolase
MTSTNNQIVTDMLKSLLAGDMAKTVEYLSQDVIYHNMPWEPVNGHAGVREVLDPWVHRPESALKTMDILHSVADGEVVLNVRRERWENAGVSINLPTTGFFVVRDGLILQWDDYWDVATLQPLIDTLSKDSSNYYHTLSESTINE